MSVVINELEIVVATPGGQAQGAQPQAPATGAAPLTPLELAELLDRRVRQELRRFAH